jgi:hypothetical protein
VTVCLRLVSRLEIYILVNSDQLEPSSCKSDQVQQRRSANWVSEPNKYLIMIGTSTFDYIWVKSWVVILHSIAPICVAYCILTLCLPTSWRLPIFFECWALAETIFCLVFYLYQRHQLQRPALHPPPAPKEERQTLFRLCQESTQDVARYLSGWFFYAPLASVKRENVKEFFRWAFLNTDRDDPTYDDELEEYVKSIELGTGLSFEHGRADIKCLRLTLDKVDALHRSLVWYSVRFSFCSRIASVNISVVHLCRRPPHACLHALPPVPPLPCFNHAIFRRLPLAAAISPDNPPFSCQKSDILVSPSYFSDGVTDTVPPRYRSWPVPLHGIHEGIEPRTAGRGWCHRDPCS